jgi:hypothetical protein
MDSIFISNMFHDSLCIGLLQLNAVAQNVLTRTAVLATFLFATAGLALGARLTARLPQFNGRKCRNTWESVRTLFIYSKFEQHC